MSALNDVIDQLTSLNPPDSAPAASPPITLRSRCGAYRVTIPNCLESRDRVLAKLQGARSYRRKKPTAGHKKRFICADGPYAGHELWLHPPVGTFHVTARPPATLVFNGGRYVYAISDSVCGPSGRLRWEPVQ